MGVVTSWYDGLPLQTGNILSLKKLKSFTVLEAEATGMNGWDMEGKLKLELKDGQSMEQEIKLPSCFICGMNNLGVFIQDFVEQLKGVQFDVK
jgi:hypothetical protein